MKISHDKQWVKKKYTNTLLLLGIGFAILCFGIFVGNIILFCIGTIMTLLFGWSCLADFNKKNLPSLTLNEKGIIDNIEFISYGLIEWSDILGFRIQEEFKDIILIDVKDSDKYLNKLRINRFKQIYYKMDVKNDVYGYGTVVFLNVKNIEGSSKINLEKITKYWSKIKTTTKIL